MHGAVPVQARGLESLKHCRLLRNCEFTRRAILRGHDCLQRPKVCVHAEEYRSEKSRNGRDAARLHEPLGCTRTRAILRASAETQEASAAETVLRQMVGLMTA